MSTSLYYPPEGYDPSSNKVAWLANSIDGPYAGKADRLTKCSFQLVDDNASTFFVFYNSRRAFLTSCSFNNELLPALQFIRTDLDLTHSPIAYHDMLNVGARNGGERMPPQH